MADIFHYLTIKSSPEKIFERISTPTGLDSWWSKDSSGKPENGETYRLSFGPEYNWEAMVSEYNPFQEFEITFTIADNDWLGTRVGFALFAKNDITEVQFYHKGWQADNEHFRISNCCWAMYLRILKRNLEFGEEVPYEDRLDV